ncbi:hypothetical protein EIP91_000208 [Steccherinum ochraceum]|uniref:Protein phosphatase n=1 Tax=Steccherinum ochraceum TaxID=92696 RepID=A0A4R0S394_9APHY|nr:hypothetical protein EIP91_000208 [Steccherinum ochraceum]
MKTIHKRLYTALPRPPPPAASSLASSSSTPLSRVRSNSVSSNCSSSSSATSRSLHTSSSALPFSFFESPPPPNPSSRPTNIIVSSRPPVKAEAESPTHNNATYSHQHQSSGPPPYPLAFSSSQSDTSSSHIPSNPNHTLFFPYPSFGPTASLDTTPTSHIDSSRASAHQNTRYHLDVGAYGIAKHSRDGRIAGSDGRSALPFAGGLQGPASQGQTPAVQVGEDAYFVRDNAMGVADGVGGWSKSHRNANTNESTPSALFAQRLMHYCSEEVDAALDSESAVFEDDIHDQVDDSLEDLVDGLDVLMILERAYDKTMRAHVKQSGGESSGDERVVNPSSSSPADSSTINENAVLNPATSSSSPKSTPHRPQAVPILEGSATALLAVLDHGPVTFTPPQRTASNATAPSSFLFPRPRAGLNNPQAPRPKTPGARSQEESRGGAVIRIAHLGDCMGMLIRGEEIVWRTEEMWWNVSCPVFDVMRDGLPVTDDVGGGGGLQFNTPVQLGPSSSTRPQDAKIFTVPVQADDILVLASDGLSDNLWDEDILDEVIRFRRGFMDKPHRTMSTTTMQTQSDGILGRRTLAGMLSEALCSRARSVSERRGRMASSKPSSSSRLFASAPSTGHSPLKAMLLDDSNVNNGFADEVPFARRAREHGKCYRGGKPDDISVLIAVVSPLKNTAV